MATAGDLVARANFELRNTHERMFPRAEMLSYVNRAAEMIHSVLAEAALDLVCTGEGSLTTAAGVGLYDLAAEGMGDLWVPVRVETQRATLRMIPDPSRSERAVSGEPIGYWLEMDRLGLWPTPMAGQVVYVRYVPAFSEIAEGDQTPFKGLFDAQMVESIKILAKNRNRSGSPVDGQLHEIVHDRALALSRLRRRKDYVMRPAREGGRRCTVG